MNDGEDNEISQRQTGGAVSVANGDPRQGDADGHPNHQIDQHALSFADLGLELSSAPHLSPYDIQAVSKSHRQRSVLRIRVGKSKLHVALLVGARGGHRERDRGGIADAARDHS
jgi:hypothetical protein